MKLALFLLALCTSLASARIGETPEECAARYGKEIKPGVYSKGGVTTDVWFHQGRCVALRFLIDCPDLTAGVLVQADFPESVAQRLLHANKGKSDWGPQTGSQYAKTMMTNDGSRRAMVSGGCVMIQLVSDIERRQSLVTPAALDQATKGF